MMSSTGLQLDCKRRDSSAEEPQTAVDASAPAAPRGRGAAAPRRLADEQTRTIVGALAKGPCRPSQLEGHPGIAHGSLYTRLAELTTSGLLAIRRFAEFPRRVEYRLSDAGRKVFANELLIERQERRRLSRMGPAADGDLGGLLRLLAPLSRIGAAYRGSCVFVEHEPPEPSRSSLLTVADEAIALSEHTGPFEEPTRVTATPDGWNDALLTESDAGLAFAGDHVLARTVLGALAASLRA